MFLHVYSLITLSAPISRYMSLPCLYTVMSFGVNKVERRQFMIYKVCVCQNFVRPPPTPRKK